MFSHTVPDVDRYIVSYFNIKELCNACAVSKKWRQELTTDAIWSKFYSNIKLENNLSYKQHFNSRGIVSINGLIKRIEEFKAEVPSHQNGELHCYFPKVTKCHVNIKIKNDKHPLHALRPSIKELYWFMEVNSFDRPVKDMFTLTNDCTYIIHTRMPNNIRFKYMLDKIILILTGAEEMSPRKTYATEFIEDGF